MDWSICVEINAMLLVLVVVVVVIVEIELSLFTLLRIGVQSANQYRWNGSSLFSCQCFQTRVLVSPPKNQVYLKNNLKINRRGLEIRERADILDVAAMKGYKHEMRCSIG